MNPSKIILNIVKVIHEKLEIAPEKDKVIAISLWDFIDENGNTIPKMDLKKGLRKLAEDEKLFQLKDIQCLDRLGRFAGETIELEKINCEHLREFYKECYSIREPEIYYNFNTGVGFLNDKKFKLKLNHPGTKVFEKLYERIGERLPREEVLKIIGSENKEPFFKEPRWVGLRKTDTDKSDTYTINEVVTKIRKRTGLTPDQLVNNNGNLTLVVRKMEKKKLT